MNTRLSLSALTILLLAACGDEPDLGDTRIALRQSDQPGHRSDIRSMDDLRQVMVMGMSTNDIVSILGNPSLTDNVGEGIHEWRYFISSFPADDEMKGSYVIGLILGITNRNLAKWTCAYATPSELNEVQTPSPVNGPGPTETRLEARSELKLFLVSNEPIPGGRSIHTEQLPKLGFIPSAPNLIISTVKKVSWQEQSFTGADGKDHRFWSFSVRLNEEDAAQFELLTANNVSKQLLLVIGDVPVSAPRIMAPLKGDSIIIECEGGQLVDMIKERLSDMVEQEPVR